VKLISMNRLVRVSKAARAIFGDVDLRSRLRIHCFVSKLIYRKQFTVYFVYGIRDHPRE
jgi:hypothetical protein